MIRDEEAKINELESELESTIGEGRDAILETIYEAKMAIGEIRGALLEMADVDGLDDWCEAFDY